MPGQLNLEIGETNQRDMESADGLLVVLDGPSTGCHVQSEDHTMGGMKPFRFGVNVWRASSRAEWAEKARKFLGGAVSERAAQGHHQPLFALDDRCPALGVEL